MNENVLSANAMYFVPLRTSLFHKTKGFQAALNLEVNPFGRVEAKMANVHTITTRHIVIYLDFQSAK